jgi:hypothetical protein
MPLTILPFITKTTHNNNAQADYHLSGSRGKPVVQASTVIVHADLSHSVHSPRGKGEYCGRYE